MKLPCEIIQDLLPLYYDGVCNDISNSLVKEHLTTCKQCREMLHQIDFDIKVPQTELNAAKPLKSIEEAWKKRMWKAFTKWFTIIVGSVGILIAVFCMLTQWKFITVSTDGITVKEIYQFPDDTIIYRLNIPEDTYASCWDWEIQDDGSGYQIPKRSIIELNKDLQVNQLDVYLLHDINELNSSQFITGGKEISSWYIGDPSEAILIWNEEMDVPPAPNELLEMWGYDIPIE